MNLTVLLFVYGCFLIFCGVMAIVFIGLKAKTALVSGGFSGLLSMGIGHLIHLENCWAPLVGVLFTLALFGVFAWRSTLTLQKVFELIPIAHPDLQDKTKAFLIIGLMAVVSMVVTIIQSVYVWGH
jgi:hypothetical protein